MSDVKRKMKGAIMFITLAALAIFITLGVAGIFSIKSEPEKLANEVLKDETGVDLQAAEEKLIKK
jgi:hypothetical protein